MALKNEDFPFEIIAKVNNVDELKKIAFEEEHELIVLERMNADFFDKDFAESNSKFYETQNVLVVSDFDKQEIQRTHKMGVKGFITNDIDKSDWLEALKMVGNGNKYFSRKVIEVLIEMSYQHVKKQNQSIPLHESLSEREMEVLMLITQGKVAEDIANELFLSIHTVYTHRKNILKKLSCKSAAELISYAYTSGLMEH